MSKASLALHAHLEVFINEHDFELGFMAKQSRERKITTRKGISALHDETMRAGLAFANREADERGIMETMIGCNTG